MPTTPSELIDINTRRQVHLERVKSHEQREFDRFLRKMRDQTRQSLSDLGPTAELSRRRLESQLRAINKALGKVQEDYKKVWLQQIKDLSEQDTQFQAKALNIIADVDFAVPTPTQLAVAVSTSPLHVEGIHGGKILDTFFKDVSDADVQRLDSAIRLGFARGETNQQITTRVMGLARDRLNPGIFETFRRSAQMMTRTALQHASQTSRMALYERNTDIIKGYRWVSTLDSRTTTQCQSLDGQEFKIGKGPLPPIHPGCRSTTTPTLDERFSFLRRGATRSARNEDGVQRVASRQTYYSWLKTQSREFQDSAIGESWAKLLNDGKISASHFAELRLDRTFRPLTLAQAKDLEPLAFANAGL